MKEQEKFEFLGEQIKKQIANIITSSRVLFASCLLFCPVFSVAFYILYLFCGITDMVDGTVARKTKTVSKFGAKLDTVADIMFVTVCFIKILPLMHFPIWLWVWIAIISTIKIGNILCGFICGKHLISIHTFLNKTTGFVLFLFPLTIKFIEPIYSSMLVCFLAMLAAINERNYIRDDRETF